MVNEKGATRGGVAPFPRLNSDAQGQCQWVNLKRATESAGEKLEIDQISVAVLVDVAKWAAFIVDSQTGWRVVADIVDVGNPVAVSIGPATFKLWRAGNISTVRVCIAVVVDQVVANFDCTRKNRRFEIVAVGGRSTRTRGATKFAKTVRINIDAFVQQTCCAAFERSRALRAHDAFDLTEIVLKCVGGAIQAIVCTRVGLNSPRWARGAVCLSRIAREKPGRTIVAGV